MSESESDSDSDYYPEGGLQQNHSDSRDDCGLKFKQ